MTIQERLESYISIEPNSGCWLWTGAVISKGYGCLRINKKTHLAHRLSFEIFNGEIPPKMHVLHKCDTMPCINPKHLFLGTNLQNIEDSMRKGRRKGITRKRPSGLKYLISDRVKFSISHMKVKPPERARIRHLHSIGVSQKQVAMWFEISPSNVSRIVNGA